MLNHEYIEQIATQLRDSDIWIPELCAKLCEYAGLSEEYANADGETFEAVVYRAADILGVEI